VEELFALLALALPPVAVPPFAVLVFRLEEFPEFETLELPPVDDEFPEFLTPEEEVDAPPFADELLVLFAVPLAELAEL
jgi:hypothetical protein